MRLIDADELMRVFARCVAPSNRSDFAPIPTWNEAVGIVEAMTEDIIRCKNCKYRIPNPYGYTCKKLFKEVTLVDFCSWSERRERKDNEA